MKEFRAACYLFKQQAAHITYPTISNGTVKSYAQIGLQALAENEVSRQ